MSVISGYKSYEFLGKYRSRRNASKLAHTTRHLLDIDNLHVTGSYSSKSHYRNYTGSRGTMSFEVAMTVQGKIQPQVTFHAYNIPSELESTVIKLLEKFDMSPKKV